jgi:hypothetical protein
MANIWFSTLATEKQNAGSSTSLRFAQNDSQDGVPGDQVGQERTAGPETRAYAPIMAGPERE